jgi:TolB-like protein
MAGTGCAPSFSSQLSSGTEAWTQKPIMTHETLTQYHRLVVSGTFVQSTNRRHLPSYGEIYRDCFKLQSNTAAQFRAALPGL